MSSRISRVEIIVLSIVVLFLLIGFYLVFTSVPAYEAFVVEDGIVEWLTVIGLLLASFTCLSRAVRLRREKSTAFVIVSTLMGLVLFFGAGEEISWGQRIFGIQSSEYFQQHNTQGETNIHNLVLGGVKINMWIFSFLLSFVLAIYLIVVPILYHKKQWMRRLIDYWGIPLPKAYQSIAIVALFLSTEIIPHGKRAELAELIIANLLFLVIAYPANEQTFKPTHTPNP